MPLFHRKRNTSLREGRFSHYLRYALGEIVLVVIGILIALQINSWNAERKMHREWLGILQQVRADMQEDTSNMMAVIRQYEDIRPKYRQLLQGTLDADTLEACGYCLGFGLNYVPFYFKQSGFRALDRAPSVSRSDSLSQELLSFYNGSIEALGDITDMIGEDAAANNFYLRDTYAWFSNQPEFFRQLPELQLRDAFYRNRLLFHYELLYSNYLRYLDSMLEYESKMIDRINERLAREGQDADR